jgi:hypothetical protein
LAQQEVVQALAIAVFRHLDGANGGHGGLFGLAGGGLIGHPSFILIHSGGEIRV